MSDYGRIGSADPATHERSQSSLSPPDGGCPLRKAHRAKMKRKAAERATRVPGFTLSPNRRHEAQRAVTVLALVTAGVPGADAEQQAWHNLAKTLPAPRFARSYSRKPSKNDKPEYRKSIWPAAKIARRLDAYMNDVVVL